jgi:hypothetical protein
MGYEEQREQTVIRKCTWRKQVDVRVWKAGGDPRLRISMFALLGHGDKD